MPRLEIWTLMGIAVIFLVLGSILPSFFLIFSLFFIAFGLYIGSKPRGVLKGKQTLNNQEIPVEIDQSKPRGILKEEQTLNNLEVLTVDDQNKSDEVSESSDNPIKQSKALAIKMKIKKEDKNPEVIVVPKESVESKKETENQEENEEEEEIEQERSESSSEKINKMQGRENKTPRKDLALIVVGILLLLISSLVSRVSSMSTIFSYLGILSIGIGLRIGNEV